MGELETLSRTLGFDEDDHNTIYTADEMRKLGFVKIDKVGRGLGIGTVHKKYPTFLRGTDGSVYVFDEHTNKSGHLGEGYVFLYRMPANLKTIIYSDNGLVRVV